MPDNKKLPQRSRLTRRVSDYRRAVRNNGGRTNRGQTKPRPKPKARPKPKKRVEPTLTERYLGSPSLFDRFMRGELPILGPGMAAGVGMGIARATGQSLLRRGVQEAARRLSEPKNTPVSPWVRRAQGGQLPTKDMTNSRAPRPDTYGGIGDIARANPYTIPSALVEMSRMTREQLNVIAARDDKRKSPARPKPKAKPAPAPARRKITNPVRRGLPSGPGRAKNVKSGAGRANRRSTRPMIT